MKVESLSDIIKKAESLTEDSENYLSARENVVSDIRILTKKLYDFNKFNELYSNSNNQILEELVLDNLDEEQIWQQIDLQNKFICKEFVFDIAQFLVKKNKLVFGKSSNNNNNVGDDDDDEDEDEDDDGEYYEEVSERDGEDNSNFSKEEKDDTSESECENSDNSDLNTEDDENGMNDKKMKNPSKASRTSVVDDKFFKLSEMEQFLEMEENEKRISDEEDYLVDYFGNGSELNDEEEEGFKYDDFFDQPDDMFIRKKRRKKENSECFQDIPVKKKKVKFAVDDEDDDDDDDNDILNISDDEDKNVTGKNTNDVISTFEARQERLKSRIKALEEEIVKEKPWQMKGEVKGTTRPQNSLLEEYVEFEAAVRPPPVMTEKTTLKLEDIIKQRIKDKLWDDVERKVKPVEDPREYKKRLVLDQEKSKLSLAQLYEQEYLKQRQAKIENGKDKPDEIPNEHLEIDKMMKSLFSKLDALSNFHFTPKMVSTEIKVISNLPAITVEEVTPVATSDAKLLAPEEVKSKIRGDLIGKTERTKTDKKRERRLKKKRQHSKQKELESREKEKLEEKPKDIGGRNKKPSKKLMKKLGRNVTQLSESSDGKYIRSSNAFFSKLQDDVKSVIKKKTNSTEVVLDKKLDVKKLKL